jgi:aminodeoxychorismate synthase component I
MKLICAVLPLELEFCPQDIVYILNHMDKSNYLCFLDSSLYPNKYSKFSYIGWEPKFIIKSNGNINEYFNVSKNEAHYSKGHPLLFLKEYFKKYVKDFNYEDNCSPNYSLPDFKGGFMGYLSYDLKNYIEVLSQKAKNDINLPLFCFAFYDKLISFNHKDRKWYYIRLFSLSEYTGKSFFENIVNGKRKSKIVKEITQKELNLSEEKGIYLIDIKDFNNSDSIVGKENIFDTEDSIDEVINKASHEAEALNKNVTAFSRSYLFKKSKVGKSTFKIGIAKETISRKIRELIIKKYFEKNIEEIKLKSNFTKVKYLKAVRKAKRHIHNGDIYQVNVTQRFKCELQVEPYDLYYILREKNPAPFSAYISFQEVKVGSSSPERFLFLDRGVIQTRPIKGTRPRGKDKKEDMQFIHELKNSIKDRAELNMIVDLERNDLGRFCEYGSVIVKEHAVIEKYARVFHSVSTITGKVRSGHDIADILKAAFPGGSITGAPKIRAMQIIDDLEPIARSIYTGSIGYVGVDCTMDLNIVIRTFLIKGNNFYYNVGGGIVEDSVAADEYRETLDKGAALNDAIKFFEKKNLKKYFYNLYFQFLKKCLAIFFLMEN